VTSARVVSSTTGFATATILPELQDGSSGGGGGGLSPSSARIVGGVVGGVGGAILLGGLAIVAWRLWGKKKGERLPADEDYLGSDKHGSVGSGNNFAQQAAPGYNNPNGAVNTASNF